jgi:CheY-like chemotaxis protein
MYVLIVEDDPFQAASMIEALEGNFSSSNSTIQRISTESQFREKFDEIANNPPDVITMDIMLRWADPSPDMKPRPEDVKEEGIFKAGLRCEKLLEGNAKTRHIPVILYTILSNEDLSDDIPERENVLHLPKSSDLYPLIKAIRNMKKR